MRLFVDDMLRRTSVQVPMALELEQEIQAIDEKQDDTSDATNYQCFVVGNLVIVEGRVEGCW